MLVPSIFGESLLDDFVNDFAFPYAPAKKVYGKEAAPLMRTDVKETKTGYELEIELPGVKKEDVKAELKDGYMTITASTDSKKEEKQDGKYIRKERYSGTTSRSFYVGEDLTQEDIKAKFENGVLKVLVPKKEEQPKVEKKSYIDIEG